MQIKREEQVKYYYEASERVGNVDIYFEEQADDTNGTLILSLHTMGARRDLEQSCIRLTSNEFIQIMPELIDLYKQLLNGEYKV